MWETGFDPWVGKIPWKEGMATHSNILAWRKKPGRLQPTGLQGVRHDWVTKYTHMGPPAGSVVKNVCRCRRLGFDPWVGKIPPPPRRGNCKPFQYSCLKNSMDRGAWQALVPGVVKSWTQLSSWGHIEYTVYERLMERIWWFTRRSGRRGGLSLHLQNANTGCRDDRPGFQPWPQLSPAGWPMAFCLETLALVGGAMSTPPPRGLPTGLGRLWFPNADIPRLGRKAI